MQEVALTTVRPVAPPLPSVALQEIDTGPPDIEGADEALLAQFEELMPVSDAEPDSRRDAEVEVAVQATPDLGARPLGAGNAPVPQGSASWQQVQGAGAESDLLSTEFSIHHARIGVVHVRQSADRHGGVIRLTTADTTLRQRLEGSAKGLKSVMTDAQGRSPEVEIGS